MDLKFICIAYYDSLLGAGTTYIYNAQLYLAAKHQAAGAPYAPHEWKILPDAASALPAQPNGYD